MEQAFWQKQGDRPLFPELEWSRPENKLHAGKLLIVGGSGYEFQAPANAYGDALEAGIGSAKVLLPNSMQKTVQDLFPEAEFAPSTPSGSFAANALAPMLDLSLWSNGVLFPGNLGRNSETTVLLETFLSEYQGQVTLTKDVADLVILHPLSVLHREQTLLVLSLGQLRQLGSEARFSRAFTSDMGLVQLVEDLHEFTNRFPLAIITRHQSNYIVAIQGQVSTTKATTEKPVWRLETAAHASVWWLQHTSKSFEALTTSVHNLQ